MSALALQKFGPASAATSTGHSDAGFVRLDTSADEILKRRFQDAYATWRNHSSGSREQFADELDQPFNRVKRWLSDSDATRVQGDALVRAERLAIAVRSGLTTEEIRDAASDLARAEARRERIWSQLKGAAA